MARSGEGSTLVVVDGHNVYNDVGRLLQGTVKEVPGERDYYLRWFDVDRFVASTIGQRSLQWRDLGVVIFRSKKAIGKGTYRLEGPDTQEFWARQGSNPNSSTFLVEIEGAPSGKDAGVDTAIVVYMFETIKRWDSVVLFSNDTDFVPAVWAMRRKGKRVFCSAESADRATPLVQACQDFYPWNVEHLLADRDTWQMVRSDGPLDQWLTHGDVIARQPRFRINGDSLRVEFENGIVTGNDQNSLNELLKDLGMWAFVDSGGVNIKRKAKNSSPPIPADFPTGDGIARHLDVVSMARWIERLKG